MQALLASPERNFKIIVIDDGSSDATIDVVRRTFAHSERVSVLSKENGGKWAALNYGLAHTDAEVVSPSMPIRSSSRMRCVGWSGISPTRASPRSPAQPSLAIKSISSPASRRWNTSPTRTSTGARSEIVNGITVVPGAIGAWRRSALLAVGGFLPDTLAEDAEATVRLARRDWKVLLRAAGGRAHRRHPKTVEAFAKQRLRWMFGTLQVAFKNLSAIWRIRPIGLGLFGLPQYHHLSVRFHADRPSHGPNVAVVHRFQDQQLCLRVPLTPSFPPPC